MSERKKIDQLFQDKLKDFEKIPPDLVWENIKINLEEKKKRRAIPLWWKLSGITASLVLGFWISNTLFYKNTNNGVVIQEKTKSIGKSNLKNIPFEKPIKNLDAIATSESINTEDNLLNQPNISKTANKKDTNVIVLLDENKKSKSDLKNKKSTKNIKITAINQNQNEVQSFTKSVLANNENYSRKGNAPLNKEKPKENDKFLNQTDSNNLVVVENKIVKLNAEKEVSKNQMKIDLLDNSKQSKLVLEEINKTESTKTTKVESNEFEELLKEKEKKTIKKQKLSRWQINTNIAPVYLNSLANGSSLDQYLESNKKEYNTSLSIGLGVNYTLSKKLILRSGINSVSMNYNTTDVPLNSTLGGGTTLLLQGSSIELGVSSLSTNTSNVNDSGILNQKMGYIELPLELSYVVLNKRFGVEFIGGMSTLFLNQNDISLQLLNDKINMGKANNLNDVHFSGNVGMGLKYGILKHLEFRVEPVIKYQFNTFSSRGANFKPYLFGLYSGIGYSF